MLMQEGLGKALGWTQASCPHHNSFLLSLVVLYWFYNCNGKSE